jgi:hypothetical protein
VWRLWYLDALVIGGGGKNALYVLYVLQRLDTVRFPDGNQI